MHYDLAFYVIVNQSFIFLFFFWQLQLVYWNQHCNTINLLLNVSEYTSNQLYPKLVRKFVVSANLIKWGSPSFFFFFLHWRIKIRSWKTLFFSVCNPSSPQTHCGAVSLHSPILEGLVTLVNMLLQWTKRSVAWKVCLESARPLCSPDLVKLTQSFFLWLYKMEIFS